ADQATRVVLDFGGVGYINSTGIALIVRLLAEARRDHRDVVAVGLTDHYREIFRITRLSAHLTIAAAPTADGEGEGAPRGAPPSTPCRPGARRSSASTARSRGAANSR